MLAGEPSVMAARAPPPRVCLPRQDVHHLEPANPAPAVQAAARPQPHRLRPLHVLHLARQDAHHSKSNMKSLQQAQALAARPQQHRLQRRLWRTHDMLEVLLSSEHTCSFATSRSLHVPRRVCSTSTTAAIKSLERASHPQSESCLPRRSGASPVF